MFLGTFEPNLLDKGRIALPKKIRDQLGGDEMILTIGFEQCIFGFSQKGWEDVAKPEVSRPLFSDKEARELRRKMFAEAESITLDVQGRCSIPERMLSYAEITQELRVIGAGDHFEIWDKAKWGEYKKTIG